MAPPTEASIYCSKCAIYNISSDNCFCDDCLQELKEKAVIDYINFVIESDPEEDHIRHKWLDSCVGSYKKQYKNKEVKK